MKKFKTIITSNPTIVPGHNQQIVQVDLPFELTIVIDKNNQIHDIQPRVADLFSKYHGRPMGACVSLVKEFEYVQG